VNRVPSSGAALTARDRSLSCWLGASVLVLYALTYASVPTSDGLSFVAEIDEALHTGRLPVISNAPFSYYLGFLLKHAFVMVRLQFPTLWILQGVNAIASGVAAMALCRILRLVGGARFWAVVGTLLVMTSYGVWYFANGEVHHVALAILLVLFWRVALLRRVVEGPSPYGALIGLGLLNAVAVFFHQEHFLFGLVVVALLMLGRPWRRGLRESVVYGVAGSAATFLLIFLVGRFLVGIRTIKDIAGWYFWQLGYLVREYEPEPLWVIALRLVKGQLTAFVYGFQPITDAVRNHALLGIGAVRLWSGLTLVALALGAVLAAQLRWVARTTAAAELRALVMSAVVWLVVYPVLLSWYFPAITEYYLKTVPPLVILLVAGPVAREAAGRSGRRLRIVGAALLVLVVAINGGSAIVPWYRYGLMRDRVAAWATQTIRSGDLVVSIESGIDPLLAGRGDFLQVKNLLYEEGKARGFETILTRIAAHLAAGQRVFVYNLLPSQWALDGLNASTRNPQHDRYTPEDFEALTAELRARYDLVPVLQYWEESQEPLYLFGLREQPLFEVRRRAAAAVGVECIMPRGSIEVLWPTTA
jgi:hypothetical protein